MKGTEMELNTIPVSDELPRTAVRVFKEDPAWDALNGRPWWTMNTTRLMELHVADYKVLDDRFADELSKLRDKHPNCVFCYVNP